MRELAITALLLIVAVIHLIPLSGFFSAAKLESLYGIPMQGTDLQILMRHRAMLFGILGVFFVYAAFTPTLQPLAFVAAFASIASFFYLAFTLRDYGAAIRKIVMGDVIATLGLIGAVILYYAG